MMNRNIGSIGECKDLIARFETNEFYVGEEIECLIHTRDKSNMYVPGNVDKNISSSFWVGVQTHGHVMPCFSNSAWVLFGKDNIILTRSIKRLTLSATLFVRDFPTLHKPSLRGEVRGD